jgi:isochorismate hydrolase
MNISAHRTFDFSKLHAKIFPQQAIPRLIRPTAAQDMIINWSISPMKQTYFTQESIHHTAQEMLKQVGEYKRGHMPPFTPLDSALLVLDMQDYFLKPDSHAWIPSAPAILPNLKALVDAYAQQRLPVIFTQHMNTPEDAGSMQTWWHDLIDPHNPLSSITDHFDLSRGTLVQKTQYDAFYKTDLEGLLCANNVRQVLICGVMTHLCCETTARSAFVHGFEVFFAIDGTATYNQDFHLATLMNLSHGFATPVLTSEILAACQKYYG